MSICSELGRRRIAPDGHGPLSGDTRDCSLLVWVHRGGIAQRIELEAS